MPHLLTILAIWSEDGVDPYKQAPCPHQETESESPVPAICQEKFHDSGCGFLHQPKTAFPSLTACRLLK